MARYGRDPGGRAGGWGRAGHEDRGYGWEFGPRGPRSWARRIDWEPEEEMVEFGGFSAGARPQRGAAYEPEGWPGYGAGRGRRPDPGYDVDYTGGGYPGGGYQEGGYPGGGYPGGRYPYRGEFRTFSPRRFAPEEWGGQGYDDDWWEEPTGGPSGPAGWGEAWGAAGEYGEEFEEPMAPRRGPRYGHTPPDRWPDIGHDLDRRSTRERNLPDDRIEDAVRNNLYRDNWIDPDRIDVEVVHGVVTLRGEVGDFMEARFAWDDAWESPGVRGVVNHLTVRTDRPDSDPELPQTAGDR